MTAPIRKPVLLSMPALPSQSEKVAHLLTLARQAMAAGKTADALISARAALSRGGGALAAYLVAELEATLGEGFISWVDRVNRGETNG